MKVKRRIRNIESLLSQIKKLLEKIYWNCLMDIILFGSFTRNSARRGSDVDNTIILRGGVNKTKDIYKIYDVLYDLMLKTDELIFIYPLSEDDIEYSH